MSRRRTRTAPNQPSAVASGGNSGFTGAPPTGTAASAEAAEPPATAPRANPYRSIFTCTPRGFELGENHRFKQRVFTFKERPAPEIIEQLKAAGFTYRSKEKTWTIPATAANRLKSEELAAEFAGEAGRDRREGEMTR